jgi:hypothetical protein
LEQKKLKSDDMNKNGTDDRVEALRAAGQVLGSNLGIPKDATNIFIADSGGKPGTLDVGDVIVYTGKDGKDYKITLTEKDVTNIEYAKNGIKAAEMERRQLASKRVDFNGNLNKDEAHDGQSYNKTYWKEVPDPTNPGLKVWAAGKEVPDPQNPGKKIWVDADPASSVRDVLEGTKGSYKFDCGATSNLSNLYKELLTIGDKAFNEKYKGLKLAGWDTYYDGYKPEKDPQSGKYLPWDRDGGADKIIRASKEPLTEEKTVTRTVSRKDGDKVVEEKVTAKETYEYVDASKNPDLRDFLSPGDPINFRNPDPKAVGDMWQSENAIFAGYNANGKPIIVCNPSNGEQKEVYQHTITSGPLKGQKVWAVNIGGTPFYLRPDTFVHDMDKMHERRQQGGQ